jgi:hypothetical protein
MTAEQSVPMVDEKFQGRVSYKTRHYAGRSECHVILYDYEPFTVLIAIEIADNPGASITNTIEDLAEHVCRFFTLDRKRLVVVEHYNERSYQGGRDKPDTWDLVTFGDRDKLLFPGWRRLRPEDQELLGIDRYTES